jgi:hypothetical protein
LPGPTKYQKCIRRSGEKAYFPFLYPAFFHRKTLVRELKGNKSVTR